VLREKVGPAPAFFFAYQQSIGSGDARAGEKTVMGQASIQEQATDLAERVAHREGCELAQCEYGNHAGSWRLCVFIDKEGGVTLEDCSAVSKQLSVLLDVEDFIPHSYHLEVSSPGIFRTLQDEEDFERSIGERVKVKTFAPQRGKRRFSGILDAFDDDSLTVREPDGEIFEIPIERVASIRLDPEV
jgi:ribosome maturation factor RimP